MLGGYYKIRGDVRVAKISSSPAKRGRRPKRPEWIDAIVRFMIENFYEELSLDDLANIAGVSKFNFCRQFTRAHGVSPLRWLWRFRIALAAEMFKISDEWDILEVALSCGFSNPSHFSRAFKDTYDVSPTVYKTQVNSHQSRPEVSHHQNGKAKETQSGVELSDMQSLIQGAARRMLDQ